jgi:AbrB family looped-hinge helix DNA binding protein
LPLYFFVKRSFAVNAPHINRPSPGTSTGRVWEIADEITHKSGRRAKRADVIMRFQAEGGNYNTASTQYHYWKAEFDRRHEGVGAREAVRETATVQVKEAGRVLLPAFIREALDIQEGDFLGVEIIDGEIRLTPLDTAVRRAQELVRRYIPEGSNLVEELIADRRREAEREDAE